MASLTPRAIPSKTSTNDSPDMDSMMGGGGQGQAQYPPDHQPGMEVPKGGSMCANCKYLGPDQTTCTSEYFIQWNGSDQLPAPADQYCSDWWESAESAETGSEPLNETGAGERKAPGSTSGVGYGPY